MREGDFDDQRVRKVNVNKEKIEYLGKLSDDEHLELEEKAEAERYEIRDKLNTELDQNLTGLDIQKTNDFLESYGIPSSDIYVFDRNQIKHFASIVGLGGSDSTWGINDRRLGVTAIFRDPVLEANNGPGFTEGIIIHESTHNTGETGQTILVEEDGSRILLPLRLGQSFDNEFGIHGNFYEEALAEFMSYLYTRDALGLPEGFGFSGVYNHTGGIALPGKYTHIDMGGNNATDSVYDLMAPSMAAYGLELLLMKSPELFPLLLNSRDSIDDRKKFISQLNQLSPGLYRELRSLPYTEEGFGEGIKLIVDKLYDGDMQETARLVVDNRIY